MDFEKELKKDLLNLSFGFNITDYADFSIKYFKYCMDNNLLSIFKNLKKELFSLVERDNYVYLLKNEVFYLYDSSFFAYNNLTNYEVLKYIKTVFILNNESLDYRRDTLLVKKEIKSTQVGKLLDNHFIQLFKNRKFNLDEYVYHFKNIILKIKTHILYLNGSIEDKNYLLNLNLYPEYINTAIYKNKKLKVQNIYIDVFDILNGKILLDDLIYILDYNNNNKKSNISYVFKFNYNKPPMLSENIYKTILSVEHMNVNYYLIDKQEVSERFDKLLNIIKKYYLIISLNINNKKGHIETIFNDKEYILSQIYKKTIQKNNKENDFNNSVFPRLLIKKDNLYKSPFIKYLKPYLEQIENDYIELDNDEFSMIYTNCLKLFIEN